MEKTLLAIITASLILAITASLLILAPAMLHTSSESRGEPEYVRVETDKHVYKIGEEIRISFYFINDQDIMVSLPSLSYGLEISGPSGPVLLSVVSRVSEGPVDIPAHSEHMFGSLIWDQKDMNGKQVPVGTYKVHVNLLDTEYDGDTSISIS